MMPAYDAIVSTIQVHIIGCDSFVNEVATGVLMHTYIIAEIGSAWRFSDEAEHLNHAREAISIAKHAGADCIKFQWVSDPRTMEQRRNVSEGSYNILAWPEKWIRFIATYCEEFQIEFMCTVFLPCDVEKLNPYVKRWKVASLENQDKELFLAMGKTGKQIIASHGATHATDGRDRLEHKSLHCTASYPAPMDSLNLWAIRKGWFDGYSDHSCNVLTGALAVACGAEIVEVHFRLSRTPQHLNPDYAHSLDSYSLYQYIANIRQAELMLGDGHKKIEKCEEWALQHKVKA